MSGLQGWADLPDGLLQSIVALLGSFPDLLAFAATCPSWRAAFSAYPSKSTLYPPLLLRPDVPVCSPRPRLLSNSLLPERPCFVTDLANQDTYMCYQIHSHLDSLYFWGTSYGHLILSSVGKEQSCLVVDVFTGVSVSPPQLPRDDDCNLWHGALTAPLASPNSHLMLTTGSHNFFWRVGSRSWLRHSGPGGRVMHIVVFQDKVFGMDYDAKLFIVHLVPQIHMQEIAVDWVGGSMTNSRHWLVACGDMLFVVSLQKNVRSSGDTFKAFRLDLSTEVAKWVKVEKLDNCAIFISIDPRSQPLCFVNPERWGGKSNCIYCCLSGSEGWIACELGEPLQRNASSQRDYIFTRHFSGMQSMWVVPSMFC